MIALSLILAVGFAPQTDSRSIQTQISTLRSLPDDRRAVTTKQLAMEIRQLPPSQDKDMTALMLANLSTEGDFGRDTLQEVTTTLAMAVKETPAAREQGGVALAYTELAALAKYEHMKVDLNAADYRTAMSNLNQIDEARSKVDFTLRDISGKTWTRSALAGKYVLVNFWATWCPPCRKEMPDIEWLSHHYAGKLVVLAISDETMEKVAPFIKQNGYTYTILLDPGRKVNDLYHVDGIPKSFVYDPKGHLVAQTIDMRTRGQFLAILNGAGLK